MPSKTVTISGSKGSVEVSKLGYGLMKLTSDQKNAPDDQAFEAIETAIIPGALQTILNSADFYGIPEPTLNLQLLNRFFSSPAGKPLIPTTFLSVKGAANPHTRTFDSSTESLRRSVENSNRILRGACKDGEWKRIDLFEPARVDRKRNIEETMVDLKKMVEEGLFSYIGLSECSAETIRRAHKVHPVSAVEVEYSPFSLDIEKNGVLDTCRELNIPIIAYSPLGRGLLTGTIRSPEDVPEGDFRRHLDRFQPENFHHNLKLVDAWKGFAEQKGCTSAQLCLAWLLHQDDLVIPIPGSSRPAGVKEAVDALDVVLTPQENQHLRELCEKADIRGGRYNAVMQAHLEG